MKKTTTILLTSALALSVSLSGCGFLQNTDKTVLGAGAGTAAGAAIGAGIGNTAGNAGVGALIGGVVGGVAGGLIGNHMEKQAQELEEQVPEAEVERVNDGEAIRVTFDSGILFGFDNTALSPESREALTRFAANMNANPKTDIRIIGHTDSTGKHSYNVDLSKRRAQSVVNFLREQNVSTSRITMDGVGPDQPIADNGTPEGRAKNRRVEIFILPSEEMIQEAKAEAQQK
jgi:outer membrane protein OmpA-like peptidoglycan-associated protein